MGTTTILETATGRAGGASLSQQAASAQAPPGGGAARGHAGPMEHEPEHGGARAHVTRLLRESGGRDEAWGELLPLVYDELRAIARRRMSSERAEHTLEATALVHEAWMRLVDDRDMDWKSRRHFFGAAAEAMRRVLVDHARKVKSQKRGGDRERVSITVCDLGLHDDPDRVLALDDALEVLRAEDPRAAEVARLRFFCGLAVDETAQALEVSPRTVMREWTYARARLAELLGDDGPAGSAAG